MTLAARRKRDAGAFKRRTAERPQDEPTIDVIDATAIDEPANTDEALALHTLYAEPGDKLIIHATDCPTRRDGAWACRCTPIAMTVGATA